MTDWEPIIGVGIIAAAVAIDWGLWRHHTRAVQRDLERLSKEAARNHEAVGRRPDRN